MCIYVVGWVHDGATVQIRECMCVCARGGDNKLRIDCGLCAAYNNIRKQKGASVCV